jgi:hypothetical protein
VVKHLRRVNRPPEFAGPDSANNDEIIIKLDEEQPIKSIFIKPAISKPLI